MDDLVSNRLYNDKELESLYAWNANRRVLHRPAGVLHSDSVRCLHSSETFESKDCHGSPHIPALKNLGLTDIFELIISKWITIN